MQLVRVSQNLLNSLEVNTLLTLEEAKWYTQNEGFIPIPRKSNKKNLYVIFSNRLTNIFVNLLKKKVKKYRISEFIVGDEYTQNYIIVLELENSISNNHYIFNPFFWPTIIINVENNFEWYKSISKENGPFNYNFIKH